MTENTDQEDNSLQSDSLEEIKDQIRQIEPDLLQSVPEDQQNQVIKLALEISRHAGPLPSPKTLELYKNVMPDLPERIVKMAEKEGEHRRAIEMKLVRGNLNLKERGQWFGLLIAIFTLSLAGVLIWNGYSIPGSIIGVGGVASLVAIFVTGQYFSNKGKNNKEEEEN